MHAVSDTHETDCKPLPTDPAGLGADWIDQLDPAQRSTNNPVPVPDPTAVHAVSDEHDTPASLLAVDPPGAGVDWIDQVVPFQRSASGRSVPPLPL